MALKTSPLPAACAAALETGLARIAGSNLPSNLAKSRARLAVRSVNELALAVRLYRGRVEAPSSKRSFTRGVHAVGWRCFVPGLSHDQSADVIGRGSNYRMTVWREGMENTRFLDAMRELQNRPQCRAHLYELRCLEIPGLHLTCAWAYRSREDQLFVLVSPLPIPIQTGKVLDLADIQSSLYEEARARFRRRKFTDDA